MKYVPLSLCLSLSFSRSSHPCATFHHPNVTLLVTKKKEINFINGHHFEMIRSLRDINEIDHERRITMFYHVYPTSITRISKRMHENIMSLFVFPVNVNANLVLLFLSYVWNWFAINQSRLSDRKKERNFIQKKSNKTAHVHPSDQISHSKWGYVHHTRLLINTNTKKTSRYQRTCTIPTMCVQ